MHEILLGIAIDIVLALLVAGGKWIYGKVRLRNEQIAEIHEEVKQNADVRIVSRNSEPEPVNVDLAALGPQISKMVQETVNNSLQAANQAVKKATEIQKLVDHARREEISPYKDLMSPWQTNNYYTGFTGSVSDGATGVTCEPSSSFKDFSSPVQYEHFVRTCGDPIKYENFLKSLGLPHDTLQSILDGYHAAVGDKPYNKPLDLRKSKPLNLSKAKSEYHQFIDELVKKKSDPVSLGVDYASRVARSTGKSYAKDALEKKWNQQVEAVWENGPTALRFEENQW